MVVKQISSLGGLTLKKNTSLPLFTPISLTNPLDKIGNVFKGVENYERLAQ